MARRRWRHVWEDVDSIDCDYMGHWGAFDGYRGSLTYADDEDGAQVEHDKERDVFSVFYVHDGKPVRANIRLERRPQKLGGSRVHFIAPCCGRTVRKLAMLPHGVFCSMCGSIVNASRRKSRTQRLIWKADKLAGHLGCDNWYTAPKERPKNMRRERFLTLLEAHERAKAEAMSVIGPRLARGSGVVSRLGKMLRYEM